MAFEMEVSASGPEPAATFELSKAKVDLKKGKIKADLDPGQVDLSQFTPKLVAEITLGDLEFELTISENGQYDCKLKGKSGTSVTNLKPW